VLTKGAPYFLGGESNELCQYLSTTPGSLAARSEGFRLCDVCTHSEDAASADARALEGLQSLECIIPLAANVTVAL
jgi:hypothetical protein